MDPRESRARLHRDRRIIRAADDLALAAAVALSPYMAEDLQATPTMQTLTRKLEAYRKIRGV